jgi:hypothetical protein
LVRGQRYIVKGVGVAVYDGVFNGELKLEGGGVYYSRDNTLRFLSEGVDGMVLHLIGDGRDIVEPEKTRQAREQMQRERLEAHVQARKAATEWLGYWGIVLVDPDLNYAETRRALEDNDMAVEARSSSETVQGVTLSSVTVGQLMAAFDPNVEPQKQLTEGDG